MEEYNAFKAANLKTALVNGKTALVQQVPMTEENIALMKEGNPPLDANGVSFELHHVGQKNDGTLAILTPKQHRGKGIYSVLHPNGNKQPSEIDRKLFESVTKPEFWKAYVEIFAPK